MPASFMKCVFSQSFLIFRQVIHNDSVWKNMPLPDFPPVFWIFGHVYCSCGLLCDKVFLLFYSVRLKSAVNKQIYCENFLPFTTAPTTTSRNKFGLKILFTRGNMIRVKDAIEQFYYDGGSQ